jgi:hypothetical protein
MTKVRPHDITLAPVREPMKVFAIDETNIHNPALKSYESALDLFSRLQTITPRDSRNWLTRCFYSLSNYSYRAANGTEISLNILGDLTVNVTAMRGPAYFVIKVARVNNGEPIDAYDYALIRIKADRSVEFIHTYRKPTPRAGISRIPGLDTSLESLHIICSSAAPAARPTSTDVTTVTSQRAAWPALTPLAAGISTTDTTPKYLYFKNIEAQSIISSLGEETLSRLLESNNYSITIGSRTYNCRPCSLMATQLWYSVSNEGASLPATGAGHDSASYTAALDQFVAACQRAKEANPYLEVDVCSLQYLFEHKFLGVRRLLTPDEENRFLDAAMEIFPSSPASASTECLYIPAGTITTDRKRTERAYVIAYPAVVRRISETVQVLQPNLESVNAILAAAGKETYLTLRRLENSLSPTAAGSRASGTEDTDSATPVGVGAHTRRVIEHRRASAGTTLLAGERDGSGDVTAVGYIGPRHSADASIYTR